MGEYMALEQCKKEIIKNMQSLNTYKPEFKRTIEILAGLYVDIDKAQKQFQKNGGEITIKYTNTFGATNSVKNPYYLTTEGLRDDILNYSREPEQRRAADVYRALQSTDSSSGSLVKTRRIQQVYVYQHARLKNLSDMFGV